MTQRGNRREPIFFEDGDQDIYRDLLAERCEKARVEIWAYCLMPNHVHLIAVPADDDGLGRAIGEAHRRYTNFINARGRWTGHLFQARFASVVMDEEHLIAGARYVSLNPVRARLVQRPEDWPWSSVRAHLSRRDDGMVRVKPLLDRVPDFAALLRDERADDESLVRIREAETTGVPSATPSSSTTSNESWDGVSHVAHPGENPPSKWMINRRCCDQVQGNGYAVPLFLIYQ